MPILVANLDRVRSIRGCWQSAIINLVFMLNNLVMFLDEDRV